MQHHTTLSLIIHLLFCNLSDTRLIWKNDISISSADLEEDLERIPSKFLASLGLIVDKSKMERFLSLTDSLPEIKKEYQEVPIERYDYHIDYGQIDYSMSLSRKRLADGKTDYDTTQGTFINGTVKEFDYNFDEFKEDYESRLPEVPEIGTIKSPVGNMSVIDSEDDRPFDVTETVEYSDSCLAMSLWKYLFFGVPCFVHEITHITDTGKFVNITIFFFKTFIIVFPALFFILLSCWCYNGMCSCIFPHELFHPYQEIIKIKREAYRMPPGVYIDEDGATSVYTPTEEEKRVYEELLRLIRS